MRLRSTARLTCLALTAAMTLAVSGTAGAHDEYQTDGAVKGRAVEGARHAHQHGDGPGHLPASSAGPLDLISKLKLRNVVPEKIADVGVLGDHAYLASWGVVTCKYNGVHVVDIADLENPKEVAFIQSKEGSYPGEGIQALPITTKYFKGDLLVSNNEKCNEKNGFGGLNLYDVTNPAHPTPLVEGLGDSTVNGQGKKQANEIHSVFAWDAGDNAYAVIVDNEEGPDVDIIDITNPKKAFLTAEYDLDELFPQINQSMPDNLIERFLHDMVVKEIDGRQILMASYWDSGYVKVDLTDVKNPVYLADSDFAHPDSEAAESGLDVPAEGNAHQAEFTDDNQYIVAADEDFAPYASVAENVTDDTKLNVSQGSDTKPLEEGQTLTGPTTFVGRACPGDATVPAGDANAVDIAVVERGVCDFTVKVAAVIQAGGYDGVLVFNRQGSDACDQALGMSVAGDIHAFGVATREQGYAIFGVEDQYDNAACLAGDSTVLSPIAVGTKGDTVRFASYFDGWGYVHLYRNGNGKLAELDTYAIPEAHDPEFATGFGDLSVHEVATSSVDSNRLYFSYYSGGVRVAEIENDSIVEKAHFIAEGGSNIWGVQTFMKDGVEYVAASDRDFGLQILRYTP